MMIFQLLFVLFALFAIVSVGKRKQEGDLSLNGAMFWIVFWVAAIVGVFSPNALTVFANHLGIGRGSDLVLYVAMALIFFVLFRLHVKLHKTEALITQVVRQEALDTVKKKTP